MLVLSRYPGESIIVGDDVVVTVLAVRGDKVRLGVTAPERIVVDRMEVRLAKDAAARSRDESSYWDDHDSTGRKEG